MKLLTILLLLTAFVSQLHAQTYVYQVTDSNDCDEPEPTGGKLCTKDTECNGKANTRFDGNKCDLSNTINTTTHTSTGLKNISVGKCVCSQDYAKMDCSHKRYNKDLAGSLQFLCFIGIGGFGNFDADRITSGVLQLLMMLSIFIFACVFCCAACCATDKEDNDDCIIGGSMVLSCLIFLTTLGGLIWCLVDAGLFFGGDLVDGSGYYPYKTDCTFKQG